MGFKIHNTHTSLARRVHTYTVETIQVNRQVNRFSGFLVATFTFFLQSVQRATDTSFYALKM